MRHPAPSALALLAGCTPVAPRLPPFANLSLFEDRSGEGCAPEVVAAYGGRFSGSSVASLASDGDRLFVLEEEDGDVWLTTLDVARATAARELGSALLPGLPYPTVARADGHVLLVGADRPSEVAAVDASDPAAARVLDVLAVESAPATFAPRGGLVYTDTTDAHAIDVADPAHLDAVVFPDRAPFGAPLVVGDELLSADWDGAPGVDCRIGVLDATATPPVERARVQTDACLDAALVDTSSEAVVGAGWSGQRPFAAALVRDPSGWRSTPGLALDELGVERFVGAIAVGGGAFVIGGRDAANRGLWLVPGDGALAVAATWVPSPAFLEGMAAAGGLAWVAVSRESGAFEGVVGLDLGRCR